MKKVVALFILLGGVLSLALPVSAQYVEINPISPDGTGRDLKTLLNSVGVYSNIFSDSVLNNGQPTDQILDRAFLATNFSPVGIDVLFSENVRSTTAGYMPYHRIGWYQRETGSGAPAESVIHDVLYEKKAQGNTSGVAKTTTTAADFANLDTNKSFELRLTSATSADNRGGSIYGNDVFNSDNFRNVAYFLERDSSGSVVADSYIVAWEDLLGGGDKDYQDIVVRVKGVKAVAANSVPEPGTLALITLGGLALRRRRR